MDPGVNYASFKFSVSVIILIGETFSYPDL